MLTCKQFLDELNDYLDETVGPDVKAKLEAHVKQCHDCWVVADTTRLTIRVYKGAEPQVVPQDIHSRLLVALQRKMAAQ